MGKQPKGEACCSLSKRGGHPNALIHNQTNFGMFASNSRMQLAKSRGPRTFSLAFTKAPDIKRSKLNPSPL